MRESPRKVFCGLILCSSALSVGKNNANLHKYSLMSNGCSAIKLSLSKRPNLHKKWYNVPKIEVSFAGYLRHTRLTSFITDTSKLKITIIKFVNF